MQLPKGILLACVPQPSTDSLKFIYRVGGRGVVGREGIRGEKVMQFWFCLLGERGWGRKGLYACGEEKERWIVVKM